MNTWEAKPIPQTDSILGEGISWDPDNGCLLWVDIPGGAIHRTDPASGDTESRFVGTTVGAAQRTVQGDLILATGEGLQRLNWATKETTLLADPEADRPDTRFNDGKPGPDGRFYAGTMGSPIKDGIGSFYVLDTDFSVRRLFGGVTISNGLDWSPDLSTLYYIDTPTLEVSAFDFDRATGTLANRRTAFKLPEEWGYPDGMTADADGNLWIAHYNGRRVSAWNPNTASCFGEVLLPVSQVTCCCFGGENYSTLFITTACEGKTSKIKEREPLAGSLFRVNLPVQGRPGFLFGG